MLYSQDFLRQYGYLPNQKSNQNNAEIFAAMLKFQNAMNIKPTGTNNEQTKFLMRQTRCGEKDNGMSQKLKLTKSNLTYYIDQWSDYMTKREQNNTIINAFYSLQKLLSRRRIHLHWKRENPDLRIYFIKGSSCSKLIYLEKGRRYSSLYAAIQVIKSNHIVLLSSNNIFQQR